MQSATGPTGAPSSAGSTRTGTGSIGRQGRVSFVFDIKRTNKVVFFLLSTGKPTTTTTAK